MAPSVGRAPGRMPAVFRPPGCPQEDGCPQNALRPIRGRGRPARLAAMTIPKLVLSSPADILAAVPYLVGFHPADSLVVTGVAGPEVRLTTRWDLPVAAGDLDRLVALLRRESVTAAFVVGYGAGALVTPAVDTATRLLHAGGIRVAESLRAEGGRYWSYSCGSASCCPPEGTPY